MPSRKRNVLQSPRWNVPPRRSSALFSSLILLLYPSLFSISFFLFLFFLPVVVILSLPLRPPIDCPNLPVLGTDDGKTGKPLKERISLYHRILPIRYISCICASPHTADLTDLFAPSSKSRLAGIGRKRWGNKWLSEKATGSDVSWINVLLRHLSPCHLMKKAQNGHGRSSSHYLVD